MESLTLNQFIGIFVGITALLPSWLLTKKYLNSGNKDYMIFSLWFAVAFMVMIIDPLAGYTNMLFFYQMHNIGIDIVYFLLFIHAIRIRWENPPRILLAIGTGWFLLLFLLTSFWTLMVQPDATTILNVEIAHSFSSYYPLGAGLKIGESIVYGSSFRLLGDLYRIFVLALLLVIYLSVENIDHEPRAEKARWLWLIVWIFFMCHALSLLPFFVTFEVVSFFLIIAGAIITYIAVFIPEGMLITEVQQSRAREREERAGENL